jgi:hypothetical protein
MSDDRLDFSRREVLRTTAAGGVGSAGLFGFSQSVASTDSSRSKDGIEDDLITENGNIVGYNDGEVRMKKPEILEGGQARKEAKGAMRNEEVRALRDSVLHKAA